MAYCNWLERFVGFGGSLIRSSPVAAREVEHNYVVLQVYCCETCQPLRLPVAAAAGGAADIAGSKRGSKARSRSAPAAALDAAAAAAGLDGDPAAAAAQLLHPSRLKSMAAAKIAKVIVTAV